MSAELTGDAGPELAALVERLRRLETSTLSDADKTMRVMDPGIRPIQTGMLVGRAVTVSANDDLMSVFEGLLTAEPGDVLVVESGSDSAVSGEIFATEARRRGLAGIVIDGLCRDRAGIRRIPLPFYARGTTPRAPGAKAEPQLGDVVRCGGVEVRPGDLVVGDEDGLLVGSPAELSAVVDTAEAIHAREEAIVARIRGGQSLFTQLDYTEHLARLRAGEESGLTFRD